VDGGTGQGVREGEGGGFGENVGWWFGENGGGGGVKKYWNTYLVRVQVKDKSTNVFCPIFKYR
jgi:hypothetical protein